MLWIASFFMKDAAFIYKYWGVIMKMDNSQAKNILGINFIPIKQSLLEMGDTLIETGYIPDNRNT